MKQMKADAKGMKKWYAAIADKGFFNSFFFPTQLKGPIYCIWEAQAGMEKKDMEDFIKKDQLSPAQTGFDNKVMPIPLELIGGKPAFQPFFKTKASTSLVIIKHTWKSASDAKTWWGVMKKSMSDPKGQGRVEKQSR
jgi:hypothetical protein